MEINWDQLGFDLIPTDHIYMMTCCDGETFSNGALRPYQKLELHPASAILNYGQVSRNFLRLKKRNPQLLQLPSDIPKGGLGNSSKNIRKDPR